MRIIISMMLKANRIWFFAILLGSILFATVACKNGANIELTETALNGVNLQFIPAFSDAKFHAPVGLLHAGDGSGRLFIVEKPGIISVLSDRSDKANRSVFLDIRDRVNDSDTEQGLLGLAFHPNYENNGYLFVNYTTKNTTVIARYTTDRNDPNKADHRSEKILLAFNQPYSNHNGGELAFDSEGYLLIATGDGGSGGDPQGNGQNLKTLLGKLLRIDVDRSNGDKAYAIPSGNPFVGNNQDYREEIYAYGLRNPWRFSFDRETGLLWAADVGQNATEEINIIGKGGNYGWNVMEGSDCFHSEECDPSEFVLPIWEYHPLKGSGASVTGGYVYRGREIPALNGYYIFSDFVDGRIWTLQYEEMSNAKVQLLPFKLPHITTFGIDEQGELYACLFDGRIMRLVAQL